MSKYTPLWEWIGKNGSGRSVLRFDEAEQILGFPIDHSFLTYKKELFAYGFAVGKISMTAQTITIEKRDPLKGETT